MYTVSDDTRDAFKSDVSFKTIEVRIPDANITLQNEDILADSLELKESIESEDNLSFQGCIASSFKIECFNLVDDTLVGKWIECDIQADEEDVVPLFRGYISEVTNTTHEEFTTEIRAYDALYTINNADVTSWYNGLTFPITVLNMRNSFFSHFGITQEDDYLPNDGLTVEKTIEDKVINGSRIIKAICQVNGRFGRIGRSGNFQYVHLVEGTEAVYPAEDLYPSDDLYPADENAIENVNKAYYTAISFENYRVEPITKVQIIDKEGQIAATSGTGTNIFTLKDNPLVWGKSSGELSQVAINLYNTIQGLWYTPSEIECIGLPYVECGDFVLMLARRSIVRAYVLNRTLKGIQILTDNYAASGDRTQPVYIPDVVTQVNANAHAISTETTRASTAETHLNTGLSNEVSRAKSSENGIKDDVTRFKNVTADNFSAVNANISNLNANVANVQSLVANKANISDLTAANARIDNLQATKLSASQVDSRISSALSSNISHLYTNAITINGTTYRNSATVSGVSSNGNWLYNRTCLCT